MDLRLEENGVWDDHFLLDLDVQTGFHLFVTPGAILSVNQAPVQSVRLRNSDIITVGAVQLSFRLSPTQQPSLHLQEWCVWGLVVAVTVAQFLLIFLALR